MKRIALVEVDMSQELVDEHGGIAENAWDEIVGECFIRNVEYEPYSVEFIEWNPSIPSVKPVGTNSVVEAAYCTHRVKVGNMLVRCDECRKKGLM